MGRQLPGFIDRLSLARRSPTGKKWFNKTASSLQLGVERERDMSWMAKLGYRGLEGRTALVHHPRPKAGGRENANAKASLILRTAPMGSGARRLGASQHWRSGTILVESCARPLCQAAAEQYWRVIVLVSSAASGGKIGFRVKKTTLLSANLKK